MTYHRQPNVFDAPKVAALGRQTSIGPCGTMVAREQALDRRGRVFVGFSLCRDKMLDSILSVLGRFRREARIAALLILSVYFLNAPPDLLRDDKVSILGHVDLLIDEVFVGCALLGIAGIDVWQSFALFIVGLKPAGFPQAFECRFSFQPSTIAEGFSRLGVPEVWSKAGLNVVEPGDAQHWEAAQDRTMSAFQMKIDANSVVMSAWRQATSEMGIRFVASTGGASAIGFRVSGYGYFKDEVPNSSNGVSRLLHLVVAREDEHDNAIVFRTWFDVMRAVFVGKKVLLKLYQITDARLGIKDSAVPFWLHFRVRPLLSGNLRIVAPINLYHAVDAEGQTTGKLLNCTSTVF